MTEHFPSPPPAAVSRVLASFDRQAIEGFIAVAIDLLDLADGDSDVEPNGDEEDHNFAEDDFCHHFGGGPGCPISDPDGGIEIMPARPRYDIDQSKGPINEREGYLAWQRGLRSLDDR